MARGKTRNPNSDHQILMNILFGEDEAKKQPTTWSKWPEPQRSQYGRMFQKGLMLEYGPIVKAARSFIKICNRDNSAQ